jgi:hypothetical protein
MPSPTSSGDQHLRTRRMTVVHVRVRDDHAEVMFADSARIYRLARDNPAYEQTMAVLCQAEASRLPLDVRLDVPNGGVIEGVGKKS